MNYFNWLKRQRNSVLILVILAVLFSYEPEAGIFGVVGTIVGIFVLSLIAYAVHSISSKLK